MENDSITFQKYKIKKILQTFVLGRISFSTFLMSVKSVNETSNPILTRTLLKD